MTGAHPVVAPLVNAFELTDLSPLMFGVDQDNSDPNDLFTFKV